LCAGLPGSGKSTLALKLVNGNPDQVVENDYFWETPTLSEEELISRQKASLLNETFQLRISMIVI